MKKWMKVTLPAAALAVGVGGFVAVGELNDEAKAYHGKDQQVYKHAQRYHEVEGQVTTVTKNQIVVDIPFEGVKHFKKDGQTTIEASRFLPLKKGALVEIEENGDQAYKIETEKDIDVHGVVEKVTKKAITISDHNGKKETYTKGSNFRMDADGYKGSLTGVQAELSLINQSKVVELEVDIEDGEDD